MAKYRKKPVIIEAEQWFPGIKIENVEHSVKKLGCDISFRDLYGENYALLDTGDGRVLIESGDWIITECKKKYPCKPDIFEKTYDRI